MTPHNLQLIDKESNKKLADVTLDANLMICIINGDEETIAKIAPTIERVNEKMELPVEISPPAGSPRYERHNKQVARTDSDFVDALKSYLERHYGLLLK